MTILIQEETQVTEIKASTYLANPINESTFAKKNKNKCENDKDKDFNNTNEDHEYFLRNSKQKLESFLKYNSILNMSYQKNKLEFLEWDFRCQVNKFNEAKSKNSNS
jgi:hypothetical protein